MAQPVGGEAVKLRAGVGVSKVIGCVLIGARSVYRCQ
jgi:hypothetical protein